MSKEESSSAAVAAPFDPELATVAGIQKRVDALAAAMVEKGLRTPEAEFGIKSQAESALGLRWALNEKSFYADGHEYFFGPANETFAKAAAFIAALPTPEQARVKAFMDALGEAIDLGKKADIDVEYVNPLLALMKKLSKNALQHTTA